MLTWVRVVIYVALAACSSRTGGERERALERIPATAHLILAADGAALATPTFRRLVDSLTPHVPPSLACVVEAAVGSDAVAVAVQLHAGTTIVIDTRKPIDRCAPLSKIADRVWVATIGSGAPVSRAQSILTSSAWDRARPYLQREPIALAGELPELRILAVAQPEPVDAWVAVDAANTAAIEKTMQGMLERWRVPPTIELSGKLKLARAGTQVSVQAENLTVEDLITIVNDTLAVAEAPPPPPRITSVFLCPPTTGHGIVSCHDGTQYKVSSVETIVKSLAAVEAAPVVAGGDIVGIKVDGEPPLPFARGDVILGVDSHRITDRSQLAMLAPSLKGSANVAVRRAGLDAVISISE